MHVRQLTNHVEVLAPAKVNLLLEVLTRRDDGYHEIETVMVGVTIFDTLRFTPRAEAGIELRCRWGHGFASSFASNKDASSPGELPPPEQNLVYRAVERLRDAAGFAGGASIDLVKRIPAAAGLGGASSDAAAALVGANVGWRLGWPVEKLAGLAAEIGSDVPFFLTQGAAVCRGRGERLEPVPAGRLHFVIVRPPVGMSTARVYGHCRPAASRPTTGPLVAALERGDLAGLARNMKNDLQAAAAALTPWIDTVLQALQKLNVTIAQMSGSGSSCFGLCRSARHAGRVAALMRARRLGHVAVATTAIGSAMVVT